MENNNGEKREVIFIDGMMFKKPHENAPGFIKGNISIKVDSFVKFAQEHQNDRGWLNIDLMKSKGDKLYLALNTYERGARSPHAKSNGEQEDAPEVPTVSQDEIAGEDIFGG